MRRRRNLTGTEQRAADANVSRAFRRGLLSLVVIAVGVWFAFGGGLPFADHYEIKAVFRSADNVKKRTPVRIAGVQVGEVTGVEAMPGRDSFAVVTMRIDEGGRPIHTDATLHMRPRLFLEGNFFVDLRPGTPGTEELADGGVVPAQQTSGLVPISDVLNMLQRDTRTHFQTLLREYSSALEAGGAAGYRRSIRYWEPAYRDQAIANDAWLGTEPHDLSGYIAEGGRVARGLDADRAALRSLITDFDTAAAAFAREADALEAGITELPRTLAVAQPALRSLDSALPSLRRFARDLGPTLREADETIDVSIPYFRELRRLASRPLTGGLARDLKPVVPSLARGARASVPVQEQLRLLTSCENEVLGPWGRSKVGDPNFPATGPVFEELPKNMPGVAAESRSGDGNGQWIRSVLGAGDTSIQMGPGLYAQAFFPILGTNPPKPTSPPPLRPDVPCETQEPPDMRSRPGAGEPTVATGLSGAKARKRYERAKRIAVDWARDELERAGLDGKYRVSSEEITP